MFISICILSYNRPEKLKELLSSIDLDEDYSFEIIVCDDFSPRRDEIRKVIDNAKKLNKFNLVYFENSENHGYDQTFIELVKKAKAEWLIFMGDDDLFVPGSLNRVSTFLMTNPNLGYVLKSHLLIHDNNESELFRYFDKTTFFPKGEDSYVKLFRRSVYIAGFMIKRSIASKFLTDRFNGTMLIQLYLLAEAVLRYPSAYLDIPFTKQFASHDHNNKDIMFDKKRKKFIPRKPTIEISINFLKSFSSITEFIDSKYKINTTSTIKQDMSKYFYPSLSVHRNSGVKFFINYVKELNKIGFNVTIYYYLYVILLLIFGKKFCDFGIRKIKNILGKTPQL